MALYTDEKYSHVDDEPDPELSGARNKPWIHLSGHEWLAANPFYVPLLRDLLERAMNTETSSLYISHSTTDHAITPDPFSCFPTEIKYLILENLNAKDIATLQLASRAFRQLPVSIWYQQIRKDMPWLWEIWDDDAPYFWATVTPEDIWNNRLPSRRDSNLPTSMGSSDIEGHTINISEHLSKWTYPKPPIETTNWFVLYRDIKRSWNKMNGLRNRRRIWRLQKKMVEQMKELYNDSSHVNFDGNNSFPLLKLLESQHWRLFWWFYTQPI